MVDPGGGGGVEVDRLEIGIGGHAGVAKRGEPGPRLDAQEVPDRGSRLGLAPCLACGQTASERDPKGGEQPTAGGTSHLTTPNLPIDVPIPGASTWNT